VLHKSPRKRRVSALLLTLLQTVMATLYKRGRTYYAQFVQGDKRRQLSLKTKDQQLARKLLHKLESAHLLGEWDCLKEPTSKVLSPPRVPGELQEQIDLFLESRALLRPASVKTYHQVLTLFNREGADLNLFLSKRSGATQLKYFRHLKIFFGWSLAQGWIRSSPIDAVSLPRKPVKEADYFSRAEVGKIVAFIREHAGPRERSYLSDVILFVCQTGLRLSEMCALRWEWVQEGHLELRCTRNFSTKSGRDERVYLTNEAQSIIGSRIRKTSYVFECPSPQQLSHRFLYWRRRAGVEHGSFHSLRHTCASWMVLAGCNTHLIKRHLRHSSIIVTERYMHLSESEMPMLIKSAFERDA
jgi:integrase